MTEDGSLSNCHAAVKNLPFRAVGSKLALEMRRDSDRDHRTRTGAGRRARDRLVGGDTTPAASLRGRPELENHVLFLDDDLRESAIAVGGIEAFLLEAKRVLEKPDLAPDELQRLVEDSRIPDRIALLEDALGSLFRSMSLICATLK
jgi:hypothetical protein